VAYYVFVKIVLIILALALPLDPAGSSDPRLPI